MSPELSVVLDEPERPIPVAGSGVQVDLTSTAEGLHINVACPDRPLSRVALRWPHPSPADPLVLVDAWERSYGDLGWQRPDPVQPLPWSFVLYDRATGLAAGRGVRVRPNTFCHWTIEPDSVTLWLDFRNGGSPVRLGDRLLHAATVVEVRGEEGESPWAVQHRLARAMCDDPLRTPDPVVGSNNWYYAYGENFGPQEILRDASTIVELADGHRVRPYTVVDAGWSPGGYCPGGPWTHGIPGLFDDMPGLAEEIAARGARPGIWVRPTALAFVDDESRLRQGPRPTAQQPLDLTLDENLQTIGADVERLVGWGYELVKHDFSTYDLFGRWGFEFGRQMTDPGWSFADNSLTNAEILLRLYRTLRAAAGDAVLIGCNTVGHLAAGLVEMQRIGDDTSGREWARTLKMGVNTLPFRLAQHETFFMADADCVPCTPQTPWEKNRQFLDLIARSGTPLFLSVDPEGRTPQADRDMRAALRIALDGGTPGGVEPLDWLQTRAPSRYRAGSETVTYTWTD